MTRAGWLLDEPIFRQNRRKTDQRSAPMTVCIAARSQNTIVLASDRLLTAGDVQFEPDRLKVLSITSSIVVLTAGDASYLSLVLRQVMMAVNHDMETKPDEWVLVTTVADYYVRAFNELRSRMAEQAILAPLGLTRETFLTRQAEMQPDLVRRLASGILDYQVPECAVLIAGLDPNGTHIYSVEGINVNGHSDIGFAAIGQGARHAKSQFMQAAHAWQGSLSDTLFLTYLAKRRAEAAPTVGTKTDMWLIGPGLGQSLAISDEVTEGLEREYKRIVDAEKRVFARAKDAFHGYVDQILARGANQPVADQGETPPGIAGPEQGKD